MSPSRLRGTAVGTLTAALAVAAHGYGGGGLPSAMDLVALLIAAAIVGAVVAETPLRGRGRLTSLAALFGGQLLGHLVLVAAASGHALEHPLPMLVSHAVAAVVCAALIELVERLYEPLTALIRVAGPRPTPALPVARMLPRRDTPRPRIGDVGLHSISRRGPPVRA